MEKECRILWKNHPPFTTELFNFLTHFIYNLTMAFNSKHFIFHITTKNCHSFTKNAMTRYKYLELNGDSGYFCQSLYEFYTRMYRKYHQLNVVFFDRPHFCCVYLNIIFQQSVNQWVQTMHYVWRFVSLFAWSKTDAEPCLIWRDG